MAFRRFWRSKRAFRRFPRKAKVSSAVKRYVKRATKKILEVYYNDLTLTTAATTTAQFNLLNGIDTSSADDIHRMGDQIKMLSVQIKGSLSNNDSSTRNVRMILFYDKQANGAAPAQADILTGNGYAGALRDPDWRGRYIVLKDWFFDLAPKDVDDKGSRIINYFKRINLKTQYNGTGATITSIDKGSLYLYIQSSDSADGISVALNTRVRYNP